MTLALQSTTTDMPSPVIRPGHYAEKIVIVDGLWGCGKTMLSPIIAALERVELLAYSYELEYICSLASLGKITTDAAATMVRLLTDLKLYNVMMARDVNFRVRDLSSVFRDARPWRYLKRLFQAGDEQVPARIQRERPILHLTTHNLLGFAEPVVAALQHRVVFIELVRHPLFMFKQQALNMAHLIGSDRDFTIYYDYAGQVLPYYVQGWEPEFLAGNATEKAVYYVRSVTQRTEALKQRLQREAHATILTIPFERFVVDPWPYVRTIEQVLGTTCARRARRMMKKQKVPRARYADGLGLDIYKRCGWEPSQGRSNQDEFARRRQGLAGQVGAPVLALVDDLCAAYEQQYLRDPAPVPQEQRG